ncbi:hypothetical protein [Sediminibacillus massiliensis]|uniref:hypothetical protein n=1 Tax=Sediminibacillus massiliensis TaxID=1926277 RepID=UPI0015C2C58F|nr:hypothetical protein [Sediminibacillus massiliensis]
MTLGNILIGMAYLFVQLFSNKLIASSKIGPNRWLSFSGGIAVSYVFVYVLPSLHKYQEEYGGKAGDLTMETELYFIGLIGVMLFYTVHKAADKAERKHRNGEGSFFWIQISFFGLYNMLIAFIVFGSGKEGVEAAYYGIAIGFHYMAVSHDLWIEDPKRYEKFGRYILAGGIFTGWIVGILASFPPLILAIIFAFISGAMILNVLKKELPSEGKANLPAFLTGVLIHTIITMTLKAIFEW